MTINESTFSRLDRLFRVAHALAKHSRPITDFNWMCTLEEKQGVDLGHTYRNNHSSKEFLVSIAEVERKKIENEIESAHYITIMSDGSTDISVIENEIVYVHFAREGQTKCYFLGLIECRSANAVGIFEAILEALHFSKLTLDELKGKVIAFAGDGASVNTGKLNGVISHFRTKINPSTVMIQCMSHRVELALKDAMKCSALVKKVSTLLNDIFQFYKSPKQRTSLKEVFRNLGIAQSMPTRVGGTRWVGHVLLALRSLLKGFKAFVRHLEEVSCVRSQSASQSKAKNFLSRLKSKNFVLFAHLLVDVFTILTSLSMALQKRQSCIFQVHQQLKSTISNLQKLLVWEGPELRKVLHKDTLEGTHLTGNTAEYESQRPKVINSLVTCLEKRFNDLDNGVFKSTKICCLESWPATHDEALEFGDDCVRNLIDHYADVLQGQGVDLSKAEEEWTWLKQEMYESHSVHKMSWETINVLYKERCANILQVIDLMLSLPAGSAECERGFSQMKVTKSQFRNKLKATSMTLLMTIQLQSDSIDDFNPQAAILQWNKGHHRRPEFMTKAKQSSIDVPALTLQRHIDDANSIVEDEVNVGVALESTSAHDTRADSDYDSDFSDLEEVATSDDCLSD